MPNFPIHKVGHLNDGQFGNGRSWISNEAGKGWAQIELPKPVKIGMVVWGRDREEKYTDRVPTAYRVEVSLDGKVWAVVAGSWDRGDGRQISASLRPLVAERDKVRSEIAALAKPATVYAGSFRAPDATYLLKRGDVMQRAEPVVPGIVAAVQPTTRIVGTSDPDRRRRLADWITDSANPLPARVMVNRVWQYHFGQGLVRTPSDFGFNGDRLSHPELLDWLASVFHANGGHLKPLQRIIVLSSTYRQASWIDPEKVRADAENRLLWRYPSRRIEAEAIRDTTLQASGSLVEAGGGPGYHLWTYANYVTVFTPKPTLGPTEFRRMVYQFKPRTQQDGVFGSFDCPDATASVPRRQRSTTALQALNLLNDGFMLDQADRFAARLNRLGASESATVIAGFRIAFQRSPTDRELEAGCKLVGSAGLPTFCRVLLNANEFVTQE